MISKSWMKDLTQWKDEEEFQKRIASIRETFEETNVLLASCKGSFTHKLVTTEEKQVANWFAKYCSIHEAEPDLNSLIPFARWITPTIMKARFDTAFYLAPVEDTSVVHMECNSGEIDELNWFSPNEALSAYETGRIQLAPPTYVKLTEMRMCPDYEELMNPPKHEMPGPILPQFLPSGEGEHTPAIVLPGDKDHPSSDSGSGSSTLRRMVNPGPNQKFISSPSIQPFLSNINAKFLAMPKL